MMGRDTELIALINLIYEAALDSDLWPSVLVRLADMGANLLVEDQFSALICFSNAPGKDSLTAEQIHIFEAFTAAPHPGCAHKSTALGTGAQACGRDGTTRDPATGRSAGRRLGQSGSCECRREGGWTTDVSPPAPKFCKS
jgi:hypothetical protein